MYAVKDDLSSLIYYQEQYLNIGSWSRLKLYYPLQNQYGSWKFIKIKKETLKVFALNKEIKREISNKIPGDSWCGTLGAIRRAWRGCLNAGTSGDSISTRRIPICHTVPWQPSYCLDLLNSGGMYCVVPEWKQSTLLHLPTQRRFLIGAERVTCRGLNRSNSLKSHWSRTFLIRDGIHYSRNGIYSRKNISCR